jgi:hypothetical protein
VTWLSSAFEGKLRSILRTARASAAAATTKTSSMSGSFLGEGSRFLEAAVLTRPAFRETNCSAMRREPTTMSRGRDVDGLVAEG